MNRFTDKPWKRVLLVGTFPLWIVPLIIVIIVLTLLGEFIFGTYTFIRYGKWEDM